MENIKIQFLGTCACDFSPKLENTKIILSHLSPSLHKIHKETTEIAKSFGAEVAYDGLCIEV